MRGIKPAGIAALGLTLAFSLFGGVNAALAAPPSPPSPPSPTTVYDAIPSPLPPNVASLGFQATSTSEFGDYVHLAGTNRILNTVTVTMSDWALYSDYSTDARYTGNSATWTHPVTVNVYGNHLDTNGVPDTLLATKTENISIPWRPAADPTCVTPTAWRGSDGSCYNGFAFNVDFNLSSLSATLPNDVIVGIAFNTQSYGAAPLGTVGLYNSLNVGIPTSQTATVGTDDSPDNVFLKTSFAAFYADGGTAGVGIFRQDTNWAPNGTVSMKITASPALVAPPTRKSQCLKSGWMIFNNPSFKNQGDCVSFVASGAKNTANG
ncbi:hypothetical protein RCH23_000805 [Cryobacterium sp. CAN_C3]|uniref:hypothetical protein n=1 Tax=unclassified Cryobacterium TaxID=2649013 RepID=UPI0018CAB609|nr:hypothetical protein [Cryobacterium sp. CAN_C3]MEC5153439.1 hypothetical protein [Cryobacterium sp. CAN_C3]